MAVILINPYCSVDEVKGECKFDLTDTSQDDSFKRAINDASRWIDKRCARDWFKHSYTSTPLYIRRSDGFVFDEKLYLPFRNILSLTVVVENLITLTDGTDYYAKIDPTTNEAVMLIRIGGVWTIGDTADERVALTGAFGYEQATSTDVPTSIPDWLRRCAITIAAAFCGYNRKEVVGLDGQRTAIQDRVIPKSVYDMLGDQAPILI